MGLVLESPANFSERSWNFLDYDVGSGHNDQTKWCRYKCQNLRKLAQILSIYTKKLLAAGAPPRPHINCCLSLYLNVAGI